MEKLVGLMFFLGTDKSRTFFIFSMMKRKKFFLQFLWIPAGEEQ